MRFVFLLATVGACIPVPESHEELEARSRQCVFCGSGDDPDDTGEPDEDLDSYDRLAEVWCPLADECSDGEFDMFFSSQSACLDDLDDRLSSCDVSSVQAEDCRDRLTGDTGGYCDTYWEAWDSEECMAIYDCVYYADMAAAARADTPRLELSVDGTGGWIHAPDGARGVRLGLTGSHGRARRGSERHEVVRDDVVEWFRPTAAGVEHGFDVARGGDALALRVEVGGASTSGAGDDVRFRFSDGVVWTYSGLHAWDASGRTLPSRMSTDGASVTLHVDTRAARWPVTVDPVVSPAGFTESGGQDDGYLGISVAGVGDVDADGFDDVAFGMPGYTSGSYDAKGLVYVYTGGSTGPAYQFYSSPISDDDAYFGWAVGGAGDVDGDGYDDVLVGSPYYDSSSYSNEGAAYVYYGSSAGTVSTGAWSYSSVNEGSAYFGMALAGVGDVDGDGFDDIAISAPYEDNGSTDEGVVRIFLGSASGPASSDDWSSDGGSTRAYYGGAVDGAGDVNGDGYDDALVGAEGTSSSAGAAYLYFGGATGPSTSADWTQTGAAASELGAAVAGGRDINGDGWADLVIGAPAEDDGEVEEGVVYLYYGATSGPASSPDWRFGSDVAGARLGDAVGLLTDTNGDGFDDLAAGATAWDGGSGATGAVLVFHGGAGGLGSAADVTLEGDDVGGQLGYALDDAGDVEGDGYGDLVTSAPYLDGGYTDEGTVYVYSGGPDDVDGDGYDWDVDCDDTDASAYPGGVETTGDGVDGDCDGGELCWQDTDGDGHRTDDGTSTVASADSDCGDEGEALTSAPADDCDDADDGVHADASEWCDEIDNDCDGATDEDAVDADPWYLDDDGDGWGDAGEDVDSCDAPDGYSSEWGDCDDSDAAVSPEAVEVCNDVDDDCDGETDEDDASDATTWHPDEDGDGYGSSEVSDVECDAPAGWVESATDCDDADADVSPDALEYCDGEDDDCDGEVDEDDAVDAEAWYPDEDGDGYGDAENPLTSCYPSEGLVTDGTDCQDDNRYVHPEAEDEEYDGTDSDCGGEIEETWVAGNNLFSCSTGGGTAAPWAGALALVLAFLRSGRRRAGVVALSSGVALALVPGSALAAGRYDAHGFNLAPDDGDALDLLTTWRPALSKPYSFGAVVIGEFATPTVSLYQQNDDDVDNETLVEPFGALNLGATFAITPGMSVAVALPYYFGGDAPWGDLRVAVPLSAAPASVGLGLGVIPYVDLPTGDELHWLGNRGLGGGLTLAPAYTAERWEVVANVGALYQPLVEYENLRGGPHLLAALGGAAFVTDDIAVRAEVNWRPSLLLIEPAHAESPGEAILSARGSYAWGANWTAGIATAIVPGVGAATFRAFVGGGAAIGKEALGDADEDRIPDFADRCPADPENVNDHKDTDGCPDELARLDVKVVDEDKNVVPDVLVTAREVTGPTDTTGAASLVGIVPGVVVATATHPVYQTESFTLNPLLEGANTAEVTMRFKLVPVKVTVTGPDGKGVQARVRFEGPTEYGTRYVEASGEGTFELRPGNWRLLLSSDESGTERRDIVVPPGATEPVLVNVGFRPAVAVVDVAKKEVIIKQQVYFDVGRDTIRPESDALVTEVANLLLDHPEILQIEVQGHTDSDGDDKLNLDLSQRRVESVCAAMIRSGVSAGRLVPRGYGETLPIASNSNEEGRSLNRRVQFVIRAIDEQAAAPVEVK